MINKIKSYLSTYFIANFVYIVLVQILALSFLLFFRVCLFVACYTDIIDTNPKWPLFKEVFVRSLRFDISVISTIAFIPLIIFSGLALFSIYSKHILKILNTYFILIYSLIFALSASDIPYFKYFYLHINASILNWVYFGNEATNMIIGDKSYWIYIFLFCISIILFAFLVYKISSKITSKNLRKLQKSEYVINIFIILVSIIICFFGIYGHFRLGKKLRIYDAYFCDNTIFNQLAISPAFYFYVSLQSRYSEPKKLLAYETVKSIAKKELGFNLEDYTFQNQKIDSTKTSSPNIVFVLIESFNKSYLVKKELTPNLNKIASLGYLFENFYSQGIHTNQGIVASLYSFPSIFDKHMMRMVDIDKISNDNGQLVPANRLQQKESKPPKYQGLPQDLKGYGYNNMFFLTHTPKFDNMGIFLSENGFDNVYSLDNYPQSEIVDKAWGISDHFLFKYAYDKLNESFLKNTPFFATIMTISNHPPVYYTEDFQHISNNEDEKAMAYTDWCIGRFMEEASKTDWYKNTVFVFVGDHGKILSTNENQYDMSLSLNQVPLIIYYPQSISNPIRNSNCSGQIDIYPTIMELIGKKAKFHYFGKDILKNKHKYMYFTSDKHLGCISENYLYTYNLDSEIESLYDLYSKKNVIQTHKNIADSMKTYSSAMIETAKYLFNNNLK